MMDSQTLSILTSIITVAAILIVTWLNFYLLKREIKKTINSAMESPMAIITIDTLLKAGDMFESLDKLLKKRATKRFFKEATRLLKEFSTKESEAPILNLPDIEGKKKG